MHQLTLLCQVTFHNDYSLMQQSIVANPLYFSYTFSVIIRNTGTLRSASHVVNGRKPKRKGKVIMFGNKCLSAFSRVDTASLGSEVRKLEFPSLTLGEIDNILSCF